MKDRTLILISLTLNLVALGYTSWVHRNSERAAVEALRKRELRFVTEYAPKVKEMHAVLTDKPDSFPFNPQTLEELLKPLGDVITKFNAPELPETPHQRIPDRAGQ